MEGYLLVQTPGGCRLAGVTHSDKEILGQGCDNDRPGLGTANVGRKRLSPAPARPKLPECAIVIGVVGAPGGEWPDSPPDCWGQSSGLDPSELTRFGPGCSDPNSIASRSYSLICAGT